MKVSKLDYLIELTYDVSYKGYVADVVNLYGCMSQGKTKEEALVNAEKAIKAYMKTLVKTGKNIDIVQKSVETPIPMAYA
ncbi:type II toxin-antitoxin system HicB family antitoxin [Patescibacteria group bacterium]|nr:type II toxin-antitoxin system HicB family antitoxin [Patescibacteria group bacterium]MBU2460154.1 type II toxin-antitoxin system HicB family antitoxin [Patescibacteria group bacterium]MBU2544421.1 type II toxin-antitoxin system HicB family antitoxin [Patescibacteria group bacterium]